jgi:glutaredoxin-like YruB-family protein
MDELHLIRLKKMKELLSRQGGENMEKKVIVYTTATCPYCVMVKRFLESQGIPYEEKRVDVDRNAAIEMIEKSGQMGVPVIDVGGEIIIGYDPNGIKKAWEDWTK